MTHYLTADSRMQPYLMFPRFLMELEIPDTAKLLYMLLLDRARVSQRTPGWADKQGRIFLHYPVKELAAALHRGEPSRRRKTNYETVGKPSVRQTQFRLSEGRKSVHK